MIQFAHLLGVEHGEGVWSVLTSGPHLLAELVLLAVFDGLIGALAWPLFKRWLHRHDEQEHGNEIERLHTKTLVQHTQRLQALEARAAFHTQEVDE